ncbi:hypothetical protein H5410_010768 [Solanum commersonii]|uniref:Uncharacterized protein n=1 Tax=Solanum commersonii TaxID=4109 RepID=A0A9J6ALP4_SOLCO|nr:hypothetical protein H5410_010768 [Solanum commersonii]
MHYKEIQEKPKMANYAKDKIDLFSYIRCCARYNRNKLLTNLLENFGTLREGFINGKGKVPHLNKIEKKQKHPRHS